MNTNQMEFHYIRPNLDDKYGFIPLQDKILEIMQDIDTFCRKHEIEYCLMGGSALGAKRHGGFIPWDDDMDVFMTPENYERFRELWRKEGNQQKYYLQEWGAVDGMISLAKIRMNGTTYFEDSFDGWDIHHGIYVDILILQVCPNNIIQQLHQCVWAKYVIMKGLAAKGYSRKKGLLGAALKIVGLFPEYFLVKHGLKQVYKYRNKKTELYSFFMGRAVFKEAIYKREWFEKTVYVPFETIKLKVPVGLHEFMTMRFGDYMRVPPQETIKAMQHASFWDTKKDFKEYTGQSGEVFKDEWKLL